MYILEQIIFHVLKTPLPSPLLLAIVNIWYQTVFGWRFSVKKNHVHIVWNTHYMEYAYITHVCGAETLFRCVYSHLYPLHDK
jgi:hypothetical protein